MKSSLKYLLGSVAVAALVTVAACDQNEENKAADATMEEAPAVDNAVPMTAEPGERTPDEMNGADSTMAGADMATGDMPESDMPESDMPASGMTDDNAGKEAAVEAEMPPGAVDEEAAAGCQAVADALGVWVGKPYSEAEGELETGGEVATIRVIRPDEAVTQDFRPDRLNVELDAEESITRIYCG